MAQIGLEGPARASQTPRPCRGRGGAPRALVEEDVVTGEGASADGGLDWSRATDSKSTQNSRASRRVNDVQIGMHKKMGGRGHADWLNLNAKGIPAHSLLPAQVETKSE